MKQLLLISLFLCILIGIFHIFFTQCSEGTLLFEQKFIQPKNMLAQPTSFVCSDIRPQYTNDSSSNIYPGNYDVITAMIKEHFLSYNDIRPVDFSKQPDKRKKVFVMENENQEGILFKREKGSKDYSPFSIINSFNLNCIKAALEKKKNDSVLCFMLSQDQYCNTLFILNAPIISKNKIYFGDRYYVEYYTGILHKSKNPFLCTLLFKNVNNDQVQVFLKEQSRFFYYLQVMGIGLFCAWLIKKYFLSKIF